MSVTSARRTRLRTIATGVTLTGLLATGLTTVTVVAAPAPAAEAATRGSIVSTAASLRGRPYRYGATGPRAFDCSGFTKYVYARHGIKLPRTAAAQARAGRRIPVSAARPGDLIAVHKRGRVYHIGIYAGGGKWWSAPHTGARVRLSKIYGSWYPVRVR
jgi:cell wall-associated NlpC family hydrolase